MTAVVLADVRGVTVVLRPVRECVVSDVVDLVTRAGVADLRRLRGRVVIGASRLADVEAAARVAGVVVQRKRQRVVVDATPTPTPVPTVAGTHGCAGAVCRVPGCPAGGEA